MRRLLIIVFALFSFGCAQAQIEITTDLYSEDPQYMTEEKIVTSIMGVENAKKSVIQMASARKNIALKMISTYETYKKLNADLMGRTYSPSRSIMRLRSDDYLGKYQLEIDKRKMAIEKLADEATRYLSDHRRLVQLGPKITSKEVEQRAISLKLARSSIQDLRLQVDKFGNNWETDFETVLKNVLKNAPSSISNEAVSKRMKNLPIEEKDALKIKAQKLGKQFSDLASELRGLGASAKTSGNKLRNSSQELRMGSSLNLAATRKAVEVFAKTSLSFGINQKAEEAIAILAQGMDFYTSQIDRLQDPADPVWREITSKKNGKKWTPYFSKTFFRAEGNTSVVIARERAGHYRVKQGQNNPAALIQGQLKISRAIASGLIDVVGAATGTGSLSGLLPKSGEIDDSGNPAEPKTIAEASAKIKAINKLRRSTRASLLSNLNILKKDWGQQLPAHELVKEHELSHGRSILESHKLILEDLSKE